MGDLAAGLADLPIESKVADQLARGAQAVDIGDRRTGPEEDWSYERFADILSGTAGKTLEEFNFTFQRCVKKQVVEHL